jgi:hypothetical protein
MEIIKFVLGVVATMVALVIAVKILGFVLALVGVVLKLIWLAVIVGIIGLVCYAGYKLIKPSQTEA